MTTEKITCIICMEKFERLRSGKKIGSKVRPPNSITCSKECSELYKPLRERILKQLKKEGKI